MLRKESNDRYIALCFTCSILCSHMYRCGVFSEDYLSKMEAAKRDRQIVLLSDQLIW